MYKERLKNLRENKEETQEVIANYLNIHKGLYSQYEIEYFIMPSKHLNSICNYFNVSFDYLFNLSNQQQYPNSRSAIDKIKSGERLKEFRKNLKITQAKLAEKLNVARTIISEYEKGNFLISTHTLYTICKTYHISADYLLGKIDTPKYLN